MGVPLSKPFSFPENNKLEDNFCELCIASQKYFLTDITLRATKRWLNVQLEPSSSPCDRVLVVNGMIKTGKTTFVNVILPFLVQSYCNILHNSLFLKLDCEDFDIESPGAFVCSLLKRLARHMTELKITLPFLVQEDIRSSTKSPGYYLDSLHACVKKLSQYKHFFIILDEIQKWFIWKKDGFIDHEAAEQMRMVFKRFLFNVDSEKSHYIVTGSAMGTALVNIAQCSRNGHLMSECTVINLPLETPLKMWKASVEYLKKKFSHILSDSVIDAISENCDKNLAFTAHLVDLCARKKPELDASFDSQAVLGFCVKETAEKIVLELWENTKYTLNSMKKCERKVLFSLVSNGVKQDNIPEGWKDHLENYLEPASNDSQCFVIKSLPFRAFVLKFISPDGDLVHQADSKEKLNVDKEVKFCRFFNVMVLLGEACNLPQHSEKRRYVDIGLTHLAKNLKSEGILTASDLKQSSFLRQLVNLEKELGHVSKYPSGMEKNDPLEQVLQSALITLHRLLRFTLPKNLPKLMTIMENCDLDYWNSLLCRR